MSRSKFAIKRITTRENNPEVWDAAHALADEWGMDVNKITYDDAEWRVLNKNWISAWSNNDLSQVNTLAFGMLVSCAIQRGR